MKKISLIGAALVVAACSGSTTPAPATSAPAAGSGQSAARKYLLEQVDDAAVVQVYADGFDALPLQQKTLIWHLYQAALAGRDIFIDQKHHLALEMRGVLEPIVAHPQGIDPAVLADIQRYTKLFWINNGPYNNLTAQKFVMKITPPQLSDAAKAAQNAGATFATRNGESVDALLARLQPMFFDPTVDPSVTTKAPPAGKDILTASANNLYAGGVTMADLKGFTEKYGLNSRLVKDPPSPGGSGAARLREEVYKIDGRYAKEISAIVQHLTDAIPYASEPMQNALRALIQWYRTGEQSDREKYDIAWVHDKVSPVDTVNGFIEVYLDPRGIKGSWEGIVSSVNPEKTKTIKTIGDNAQWFEDHMPYDAKFRKPSVTGIVANAIDVVIETGDAGPVTPIGINLPNDDRIRKEYGSKSVSLSNVIDAYNKSTPGTVRAEFSWTPEEAMRGGTYGPVASDLLTDMHEVIGHASGQQAAGLTATPQQALKEHFSALEEGRADLVGLYFIADPKLAELGVVPAADQDNIARTEYESYTRNALVQLQRVKQGDTIAEDHMRNRQMVVRWLMANAPGAIQQQTRDGKTYLTMVDPKAFRTGVGRLLAEVQRIKSEEDYPAAQKLFDTYGVHFDPKQRDEVIARISKLNPPSYTGFVMPKLTPVTGPDGKIADVKISYPQDLTSQMLEWDGIKK